ncbi:MAG: hypothetical protein WC551_10420 [Patescibacteria group bacterium]
MAIHKRTTYYSTEDPETEGFEFTFPPEEGSITVTKQPKGDGVTPGYTVRYIVRDDDAQSPDEGRDDGLFLVGYHRDFYTDHGKKISEDLARQIMAAGRVRTVEEDDEISGEAREWRKSHHIFPLEAYIHSGVSLALSHEGNFPDRQWDVSQLGLVFVSKKEWRTRKAAEKAARAHVETWNQYLSGDVWGIVREDYREDKTLIEHEECWGYYGEEYAKKAALTEI